MIAVDSRDERRDLCKRLGAEAFIDFTTTKDITAEIMKTTMYGAHRVLVTATTKEGYAAAPNFLRPGGTMVAVGLPKDPAVFWRVPRR
jgi:propanol-preferring alcohol dehydrogenase